MSTGTEIRLRTSQGTIAGLAWGAEAATPVLALHGWLDNAASFQPLSEHLPDIRLVAIDFPGHGHSDWRPGVLWYHYIDYVWDVISAADELNWPQFHLLGHSLGAAVATAMAAACPERVLSLCLVEAIGPLAERESETGARLKKACADLKKLKVGSRPGYPDLEKLVRARATAGGIDMESARLLVQRNVVEQEDGLHWRSDPRLTLTSPARLTEKQILNLLESAQAPTITIESEPPTFMLDAETLAARAGALGVAREVRIEGHHHLHMASPEPVAAAIIEHLAGVPSN